MLTTTTAMSRIAAFAVLAIAVLIATTPGALAESSKHDIWDTSALEAADNDILPILEEGTHANDLFVVEGYSRWCPHCVNFASTYEEIASHFNRDVATTPGEPRVIVARVHCMDNKELCLKLGVTSFPTVLIGTAEEYLAKLQSKTEGKLERVETHEGFFGNKPGSDIIDDIEHAFRARLPVLSRMKSALGGVFGRTDKTTTGTASDAAAAGADQARDDAIERANRSLEAKDAPVALRPKVTSGFPPIKADGWQTHALDVKNDDFQAIIESATHPDDVLLVECFSKWCSVSSAHARIPRMHEPHRPPSLIAHHASVLTPSHSRLMPSIPSHPSLSFFCFPSLSRLAVTQHCKKFKPTFETIAKRLNVDLEVPEGKGRVIVARVHCGDNPATCGALNVQGFPALLYGSPHQFTQQIMHTSGILEKVQHDVMVLKGLEIAKYIEKKFAADPRTEISMQDLEKATHESLINTLSTLANLSKPKARESFLNFQRWIAGSHPSKQCRTGASRIVAELDELWPAGLDPTGILGNFEGVKQCGNETDFDALSYVRCEDYTCGLWQTFHAMSVTTGEGIMSGKEMLSTLHGWVENHFSCDVCRTHFLTFFKPGAFVGTGKRKMFTAKIDSNSDFALWLWQAHNAVNERLGKEEAESGDAKPDRPKIYFPSIKECPTCYATKKSDPAKLAKTFKPEHVVKFLKDFYTFGEFKWMDLFIKGLVDPENPEGEADPWDAETVMFAFVGGIAVCAVVAVVFIVALKASGGNSKKTFKKLNGFDD